MKKTNVIKNDTKNIFSSFGLSFSNHPSLPTLCDYPRLVQWLLTTTSSRFSSIFQCPYYFQEAEQESQQSQSGKYRKITTVESETRGFQWLLIFKRHFKVWRPSNLWVCVFLENKYTIYIHTCTGAVGAHCFFSHYIHIVIVASSLECCLVLYCSYSYTHDKTNFENKESRFVCCVQHFSFFDIFLLWNNTKYLHGNGEILILSSSCLLYTSPSPRD